MGWRHDDAEARAYEGELLIAALEFATGLVRRPRRRLVEVAAVMAIERGGRVIWSRR